MKNSPIITLAVPVMLALAVAAFVVKQGFLAADEPPARAAQGDKPGKADVARARKQVQMLDTIYKQTIVLITDKYVHDEDDFAAGSAAVLLFENISKTGFHKVRLIDATGQPYDDENVAEDDFEREGIKRLKAGATTYEQVQQIDGKPQLRTLTSVPVVMKKCVMCHDHYADVKEGEPIGAISYTIPIE